MHSPLDVRSMKVGSADRRQFAPALRGSQPLARRLGGIGSIGPAVVLVLICVYFSVTTSHFATATNARAIVVQTSITMIVAIGATFVVLMGAIDLSVEGIMAASAMTFALLAKNSVTHNDLGIIAVVAAIGVGVLFGALNGVAHVYLRIPSFMVTLGVWFVGLGVATVLFGTQQPQLTDNSLLAWSRPGFMGLPAITYIAIAALVLAALVSKYTKFGRYNYGIGADESIVRMSGVNVWRHKVLVFALAGACSALAGVLASIQLGNANVDISTGYLFSTLSGVVVGGTLLSGGRGGIVHSIVGVLILGVLDNGLILAGVNPYWQGAVQGIIIVAAVLIAGWPKRTQLRVVK